MDPIADPLGNVFEASFSLRKAKVLRESGCTRPQTLSKMLPDHRFPWEKRLAEGTSVWIHRNALKIIDFLKENMPLGASPKESPSESIGILSKSLIF